MSRLNLRRRVIWASLVLVLFGALAPVVSHALRHRALPQMHRATVLAVVGDWCVGSGSAVRPDDLRQIEQAVSLDMALHLLKDCELCDRAPFAAALPLPEVAGVEPVPAVVEAARFAAFAAEVGRRPPFHLPASRGPPQG